MLSTPCLMLPDPSRPVSMSNSNYPSYDPYLDSFPLAAKCPALSHLFSRPSTRAPSQVSTPSASRSHSPSIIDSSVSSLVYSVSPGPPSPTLSAPGEMHADALTRLPLISHQSLFQPNRHENHTSSRRIRSHKLVRNSPSLPSLSDLARASGSSYATIMARTHASKRFPLEPWIHPEVPRFASTELDDTYDFHSPSKMAPVNGIMDPLTNLAIEHEHGRWPASEAPYGSAAGEFLVTFGHEGVDASQPLIVHHGDEPGSWDLVQDANDKVSAVDLRNEVRGPKYATALRVHEATREQGYGYRGGMPHGRRGTESLSNSGSTSDDYGSDSASNGGQGGEGGRKRGRDDDDDNSLERSGFSDDPEDESESSSSEDSEDNVPLAQRIPSALQAQKSIRIKAKAERESRRKARQAQKQAQASAPSIPTSQLHGAGLAEDLTKRLLKLQTSDPVVNNKVASSSAGTSSAQRRAMSPPLVEQSHAMAHTPHSQHRSIMDQAQHPQPRHFSPEETVMRSNKGAAMYGEDSISPPLSRHSTTPQRPRNLSIGQASLPTQVHTAPKASSRIGAPATNQPRPSNQISSHAQSSTRPPLPPHEPFSSHSDAGQRREQLHSELPPRKSREVLEGREATVVRAQTLSSAAPTRRVLQRTRTSSSAPTPPQIPPMVQDIKPQLRDPTATQHRVFIGDMQRFNTVEIGLQTSARDILNLIEAQGELCGEAAARPGDWMLWELAQDFGMERPLRDFELPAEAYASWNNNTRLNAFLIKKTPLAAVLARKAIPSSSPTCRGFVQWESKRGKWNKRWMELKEHSIWLSKRSDGKDETFLCSLSSFDCYYVSRLHKAPKPFVFAVKSTENLTLFENPADYLHVFSCDQQDGQMWMERILLARSYVLHKERTVLFSAPVPTNTSTSTSSGSHKNPPFRPSAPLVNVKELQQTSTSSSTSTARPFQSGSLLAKVSS